MLQEAKGIVREWLGPLYEPFVHFVYALFPFFGPHMMNAVFLFSAVVLALWFYIYAGERHEQHSARGFFRFLLPAEVFLHKSALVDYRFYLVNAVFLSYLKLSAKVAGLVGLLQVGEGVRALFESALGSRGDAGEATFAVQLAFSVAMVLAVDFAKFFAHFLQHKVLLLWEFHKVHHSAKVLTPLTNTRVHPVDMIFEQALAALAAGLVVGAFGYFHPGRVVELTIMNIGVIYFVYFLAANLRHSHVPLGFGWRTSHVFSSPYMHQIHHSSEVRHWDRNYALIFSFWDALFHSLYVPRGREEFRLGLSEDENRRFESVSALYFSPFVGAFHRLLGRGKSGAPIA
jgi:sterol desaturase/sphingolipid hydroxylase (fatty acid hydroxylase superfamily)